jgi:hypothetical protein
MASHSWANGTLSFCKLLALGSCLLIFGCGLPQLYDIRKEYTKNVEALGGLTPVYPPREMMRIGQLWIGDQSTLAKNGGLKPRHLTNIVLSDALVDEMEKRRAIRMSSRQAKSIESLSGSMLGTGIKMHKQIDTNTLEIATLPKYTLASVDQAALSGAVPSPMASFLASLGFIQSKYLTMEAIGIEIAELPVDTFAEAVQSACSDPQSVFGPTKRDRVQRIGYNAMYAWYLKREQDAGEKIAPFAPQLYLLHKLYYMRGIRYIFNDQKAASAVLSAALANEFPAGVTSPTAPAVPLPSPTPSAAPAGDTTGTGNAALKAQIDALNAQVAAIRTTQNSNTNVAGSFARATTQGVELVELFDRPVAFGYVAFANDLKCEPNEQCSWGIGELSKDFN